MRFGYVILAHEHPELVARLARLLIEDGGLVALHFDRNAPDASFSRLKQALGEDARRVLWPARTRVGWGEWSITKATLNGLEAIEASGEKVDYVHLLSGADYPIRPLRDFRSYVERTGGDFIECYDMHSEPWIKGGLVHERYRYRHRFNERKHPKLFDRGWKLQRALGLKRKFPPDLKPYVGSQWWTLRWSTCEIVLAAGRNRAYRRYFRTVWIPDEMFIQTVVGSRFSADQRHRFCLTLFQFTDYGKPVVFANDHLSFLARQNFFFARKISPHAARLRDGLDRIVRGEVQVPPVADALVGVRSAEYEQVRMKGRVPLPGSRTVGHDKDVWRGDLSWNTRPMIAVFGASHEELRLIQQILAAPGTIESHGALFDPERIDFAGQRSRFAGYGEHDVKLRDSRRGTFLSDIVTCSAPKTVSYLLPWHKDKDIREIALWTRQSCALIVRGNIFRAIAERKAAPGTMAAGQPAAAGTGLWVPPGEFDSFHKEYDQYYSSLRETAEKAGLVWQEISLLQAGWLPQLMHFLDCAVPPSRIPRQVDAAALTPDRLERFARGLSDPAKAVVNIRGLIELRLSSKARMDHRNALQQPNRVAAPEAESPGVRLRELGHAS